MKIILLFVIPLLGLTNWFVGTKQVQYNYKPLERDSIFAESINGISFNMIDVPGGVFPFGIDNRTFIYAHYYRPEDIDSFKNLPHEVQDSMFQAYIDASPKENVNSFYIGQTEVTVCEYLIFCNETKSHFPEWLQTNNPYNIFTGSKSVYKDYGNLKAKSDFPIMGISVLDAMAYCDWLAKKTGKPYRLPTEKEWIYAAEGGQRSHFYFYSGSNNCDEICWYGYNGRGQGPNPVGKKQPNELGIYDMTGNVWEMCSDLVREKKDDLSKAEPMEAYITKGGCWNTFPHTCRIISSTEEIRPTRCTKTTGFRLALTL